VSFPQGKCPFRGEKQLESGFSILEVLVTILVVSGFLLGSLQATVLATLLRVQAQDKQQAANWVQQDLELIRYEAFVLDSGTPDPTTCTASTYGTRLRDTINTSYSTNGGVQINNKWYRVFRQYIPSENILQVNYTLAYSPATTSIPNPAHPRYNSSASYTVTGAAPTGNANVVATLSAEVIPNAALSCP
jgi:type II secretory pathway pseudopilin PulG